MQKKILNTLLSLLAVFLLAGVISIQPAAAENIIVNGTFDNNTTGWTGSYTLSSGSAFPSLNSQPYFWGGKIAKNTITQTYDLNLDEQNALTVEYTMSADLFGYRDQNDNAIFTAKFFDGKGGTGTLLDSASLSGSTNDPGNWPNSFTAGNTPNFQQISGSVPSATQSIQFELTANRVTNNDNDGYADNLSFEISASGFAKIVNIDSTKNLSPEEGMKVVLPAASYTVSIIGIKDGGAYDAWSKNSRIEGCDENGLKCKKGWEHKYFYQLGDAKKVKVKQTGRYETQEQALENPPADITFTLTEETEVSFFVKDPKNPANNQGGVSLQIVGE
ncbi:MAG: hypothetical protein AAGA60_12335 [Cyanobacteria bacterium P01_E01_bin.42]